MTRTFALTIIITALLCGAASSAAGLEIEASFQLGNLGFTSKRNPADATYTGADYFWGGSLFLTQNFSSSIQVDAALNRDLIVGNSLSALFQYKTDYFRVGIGPYLGLLNSSSTILKSGNFLAAPCGVPGRGIRVPADGRFAGRIDKHRR